MEDFPLDLPKRREIAEALLGAIDEKGYCRCPGAHLHSNKSVPARDRIGRDCRVYLDRSQRNPRGVPSLKCVHTSCEAIIAEVNHELRSQIAKHEARKAADAGYVMSRGRKSRRTREDREREAADRLKIGLATRAKVALRSIAAEEWDQAEMWEDSTGLPEDGLAQARALLGRFAAGDIVWCGEHKDSISLDDQGDARFSRRFGRIRSARPFRPASEWLALDGLPGPRICPSAFKAGGWSRSDDAVKARRFLVVEHDTLSLGAQGAALRWLWLKCGLKLRAVVYTGGKSLHGWFECPAPSKLDELRIILCGFRRPGEDAIGGMGYDPATFTPSQTYRMPGWLHEKTQRMTELWFLQ